MTQHELAFEPIRRALYSPAELYREVDMDDADSFAQSTDFRIYQEFVAEGRSDASDRYVGMLRAMHDNSATQLAAGLLDQKRVVAVMGGHKLPRGSAPYVQIAELAALLASDGYLVISGGGPGAMEASHLGAALSGRPRPEFDAAVAALASVAELPDLTRIVGEDGVVDAALARAAHAWLVPALTIARTLGEGAGRSLSIPTWHYGHEPSTPLATDVAKLFQNSIREDGLLAVATNGIIYAEGKAGTIQEIFQDAAQNYYKSFDNRSSPMVLLGTKYWTEAFPVDAVLKKLFKDQYDSIVLITDDTAAAVDFVASATPQPSRLALR